MYRADRPAPRISHRVFSMLPLAASALLVAPLVPAAPGDTALVSSSAPGSTGAQVSSDARVSPDGRYVLFTSLAPNLVADDGNRQEDLFIIDRTTGTTLRVDLPHVCSEPGGRDVYEGAFSATGRYVAVGYLENCLESDHFGGGLVRYDQETNVATPIEGVVGGTLVAPELALSADGRYLAVVRFASEEGENRGAVLHDVQTGTNVFIGPGYDGKPPNGDIVAVSMNAEGSLVAFQSDASNLVPADTNGVSDIFLFVRNTGNINRLSKSSSGVQGNGASFSPAISANGLDVAFASNASNLVTGDTNGKADIFVRHRPDNSTVLVSMDVQGAPANGLSNQPAISADGRYVAFRSFASDLVAGDTNKKADVFVRDRQLNTTTRVSEGTVGTQGNGASSEPSISSDGRIVTFGSFAANFVANDRNNSEDIFVVDRLAATTSLISRSESLAAGLAGAQPAVSANGNFVAFYSRSSAFVPGDTNGVEDIFVRDRAGNKTTRVSTSAEGAQADAFSVQPSLSADARYVAFISDASNLVPDDTNGQFDVFVRDRQGGTTTRISESAAGVEGDGFSGYPRLSADGRFVVFFSDATNLVPDDENATSDYFVRDLVAGTIERVTLTSSEQELENDGRPCCGSLSAAISADGRFVAFSSGATNIEPNDQPGPSIFVRDRTRGTTKQVDLSDSDEIVPGVASSETAISANGRFVAFSSSAPALVPADMHPGFDVFVRDRQSGTTTLVSKFPAGQGPPPESEAHEPSISADGRFVSFTTSQEDSFGHTIYTGTFLFDRQTGQLSQADVNSNGVPANAGAHDATLSGDGHTIVFVSDSTNLTDEPLAAAAVFARELPIAASPKFSVTPASLSFGNIATGSTSAPKMVTVSNTGSVALAISKIALAGTDPDQFRRVNNCPAQLPAGAQCTVSVKFKPTTKGAKSALLTVTPAAGASKSVALTGTGT